MRTTSRIWAAVAMVSVLMSFVLPGCVEHQVGIRAWNGTAAQVNGTLTITYADGGRILLEDRVAISVQPRAEAAVYETTTLPERGGELALAVALENGTTIQHRRAWDSHRVDFIYIEFEAQGVHFSDAIT